MISTVVVSPTISRSSFNFHVYSAIVIMLATANAQELTSTLHFKSYGLYFAYAGETVTFTCVTESSSMAWTSVQYIGADRLELVSVRPNEIRRAGQTEARLLNVSVANGLTTLVSQLQISVQSEFKVASITCHNLGSEADNLETILFQVAGMYMYTVYTV